MILIAGASGRLGGLVARQLLADSKPVRAMSRTPSSLAELQKLGAEIVVGDQRNPQSLATACQGADAVFTATHAFTGKGDNGSHAVDDLGNRNLIDAARAAGVGHYVFTSVMGARSDSPVDMFRYKYATEQYLQATGLSYTILRPAAFMETWAHVLGDPIVKNGKAMVFGRGTNPINFVSVDNVARLAVQALSDPRARDQVIEIGGPENVTEMRFVQLIQQTTGHTGKIQHIPLPMMRLMGIVTRPINPAFSRQSLAGILMDTEDMAFDPTETLNLFPMRLIHLEEVIRNQFAGASTQR